MTEKKSMYTLFWAHLEDLHASENATRSAIESLIDEAPDSEMRTTIACWLDQNQGQVDRLRATLQARPDDRPAEAPRPAPSEKWETYLGPGLQEGAVVAVLFLSRYKIAAYQAARQWAIMLGYVDMVGPLQESLMEEHRQAEQLSALQEGYSSLRWRESPLLPATGSDPLADLGGLGSG